MRLIPLMLTLLCFIKYASPHFIYTPKVRSQSLHRRYRREGDPGNVASSDASLDSGGDDKPSARYQFQQKVFDKNGTNIKTFRDINVRQGGKPEYIRGIQIQKRGNSPAKTSVDFTVMSDGDRQISGNLDLNRRLYEKNGLTVDASGNVNINPGQRPQSNVRVDIEKTYPNGYIGGFGQVNRESNGKITPNAGISGGIRFKRDTNKLEGEK